MKTSITVFALALLFYSCQKKLSFVSENPVAPPSGCRLTKFVQGLNNDSVFLISYDAEGRISTLTDSINSNIYTVDFDASGKLVKINDGFSNFTVEYNADNLPYKITSAIQLGSVAFSGSQYIYEFNADKQPVKRTEYLIDMGSLSPWEIKKYQFSNGDIIHTDSYMIAIGYDSTSVETTDYTYTADRNVFQTLIFFSTPYTGLGLYDLLDIDFYFNTHLFKSYNINDGTDNETLYQQYIVDSTSKNFTGAVSLKTVNGIPVSASTRHFFYECK